MQNTTSRMIAGVVLFITLAVVYMVMTKNATDPTDLLFLGGPLITFLLIGQQVGAIGDRNAKETKKQNEALLKQDDALAKITTQTNGVLDRRIRDAAADAVIRALNPPPVKDETSSEV